MLAVFPKLYKLKPVSFTAVKIEAPWIISVSILFSSASCKIEIWVVADRQSPWINKATFSFLASLIISLLLFSKN